MTEAFVHVGAHKTASTFLQQNLGRHKERLAKERGLSLLTRGELLGTPFAKEIYAVSQQQHDAANITQGARESLQSCLPAGSNSVLITNEDLICQLDIQDFYQHAEPAIEYLAAALDSYDLYVIFYIRKQTDYLESIYLQFVHLGRRLKFPEFLQRAAAIDLSWLRAVEAMERALPDGRLHLRTYEQIHTIGETGFYRDFLSMCHVVDVGDFEIDEEFSKGRPANRSYGQLGLQIAQRINPILSPKERKLVRRFLQEHFSTATHPRAELLDTRQRDEIFQKYRESNLHLFERYDLGVDGQHLGYY
jgi:hypothetical protein